MICLVISLAEPGSCHGPGCRGAALILGVNWNCSLVFGFPSHAASMLLPAGVLQCEVINMETVLTAFHLLLPLW